MTAGRCPCGAGEPYEACCAPYHEGLKKPPTAEALMRSRYSAFALGHEDYLLDTWHPTTRPRSLDLDPDQRWTHLEVLSRTDGTLFQTTGTVEFRAHYRWRGERDVLHETSRFTRDNGTWSYLGPT
ncbi:YchJ family metal-binding protein [Saccharothrix sp. BKS2]|uniref:YchJ family protein n=1 Tax=Saccharothrix sp. BKS2 TaxID=3064400 RepID=UPI0039ECACAB